MITMLDFSILAIIFGPCSSSDLLSSTDTNVALIYWQASHFYKWKKSIFIMTFYYRGAEIAILIHIFAICHGINGEEISADVSDNPLRLRCLCSSYIYIQRLILMFINNGFITYCNDLVNFPVLLFYIN
jgi:hypothetical protein